MKTREAHIEDAVQQVETETAPIAYETGTEDREVKFSFINDTVNLVALWNSIPLENRIEYFMRGFKHAGQNETSAQAGNKLTADLEKERGKAFATKTEKNTALEAWRTANPQGWTDMLKAELDKRWTALTTGLVTSRETGPRDPIGQELMVLVDRAIRERLKNERDPNGDKIKFPTNDEDEIVFANGATRTRKQMRDNFKAAIDEATGKSNEEVLRAQAENIVAARNAATAKADKPVGQGPEALGL
jgi:hypothetical protein